MALDIYLDPTTNDLALDARGELRLVGSDALVAQLEQVSSDAEHVARRLRVRLLTQIGEWALDTRFGVDWLGLILVHNPDMSAVRAELVRAVATTPGVGRVLSLTLERDRVTRHLQITFEVQTQDGVLRASGTLPDITVEVV